MGGGGGNVHDLGQDGARTTAHYDNSHELLYTSRYVVFLASDAYTPLGGGVLSFKGLMATCGQPGYVFRYLGYRIYNFLS